MISNVRETRWTSVRYGLAMAFCQTIWVLALTLKPTWSERWALLCQWDAAHYYSILTQGYFSAIPPTADAKTFNVGFFPGVPIWARWVQILFQCSEYHAIRIAGILGGAGFWMTYFRAAQFWKVPLDLARFGAFAIGFHFASFYLVLAYSESLVLWMSLLFVMQAQVLFSSNAPSGTQYWLRWTGGILAGILMTASRVPGIAGAILPVGTALLWRKNRLASAVYSALSALGILSFLAYCHFKFGLWNIYFIVQKSHWHNYPNYTAIFDWKTYFDWTLNERTELLNARPHSMNRMAAIFVPTLLATFVSIEFRLRNLLPSGDWKSRAGFYLASLITFYICLAGASNMNFDGMSRYSFICFAWIVFAAIQLLASYRRATSSDLIGAKTKVILIFVAGFFVIAQAFVANNFFITRWIE